MPNIESKELTDLITTTIDSIQNGTKDKGHHLKGSILFDVAVVNLEKAEGGLRLYVVKAEGKYASECITKIRFEIEKDKLPIDASAGKPDWSKAII
jgi:hypothetical protein